MVYFERASAADPTDSKARIAGALVKSLSGNGDGAISEMRALAKEFPVSWEVHEALAILLLGAKGPHDRVDDHTIAPDVEGAEKAISEAIQLRPWTSSLHCTRCMVRLVQYRAQPHREDLRQGMLVDADIAVMMGNNYLNAHQVRLQVNAQFGSKEVAIAEAEKLGRMAPHDPEALYDRARVLSPVGRGAEVLRDVEAALKKNPDNATLQQVRQMVSSGE